MCFIVLIALPYVNMCKLRDRVLMYNQPIKCIFLRVECALYSFVLHVFFVYYYV